MKRPQGCREKRRGEGGAMEGRRGKDLKGRGSLGWRGRRSERKGEGEGERRGPRGAIVESETTFSAAENPQEEPDCGESFKVAGKMSYGESALRGKCHARKVPYEESSIREKC